jgi:hypothetical protein
LHETLAIMLVAGKRRAKYLPIGATLTVQRTYRQEDISVEVEWDGQTVTMFAVDLEARGQPIGGDEYLPAYKKNIAVGRG